MDTIHIAYCADENYLEYLSVSLMSVLLNNKKIKYISICFFTMYLMMGVKN